MPRSNNTVDLGAGFSRHRQAVGYRLPFSGTERAPFLEAKYPPGPYTFYAQALIGPPLQATNLCTFNVK